ncbi:hypothetical protein CO661_14055 [Sinorhizobium fredii]|uniref:Helix-turn-helix domain-containing protein n=2 Tax=Rhizobium fredii TaxID=380 RepID=A0A2A6LXN0_RHIFR|nr:hypothetical protein CO661_14055 [Sinorhizobium fredii]
MDMPLKKQLSYAGMFYRMRDNWIRHVIRQPKGGYSVTERLVAVYIAEAINPQSRMWIVSQEKIAADLDVRIRVVKGAVAKLRQDGLLMTTRVKVQGHSKLFNAYELVPVELAEPL